jgi:hypothetical protein
MEKVTKPCRLETGHSTNKDQLLGLKILLNDLGTAPIWSLEEIVLPLNKQRSVPEMRVLLPIPFRVGIGQQGVTLVGRLTKPSKNSVSMIVHEKHQLGLISFLVTVFVVYTKCVNI